MNSNATHVINNFQFSLVQFSSCDEFTSVPTVKQSGRCWADSATGTTIMVYKSDIDLLAL